MSGFQVDDTMIEQFRRDGYLMVPHLYDEAETRLLVTVARGDREKAAQARGVKDSQETSARIWLTSDTGREDIYNAVCHGRRMVDTMESLMGDEVYLYHYKMTIKEPRVGGAWEWHQDYGYWYNNGCLFPDMASCYIAVDPANKENGCLQVIKGSHRMGRIEHGKSGSQTGADPERTDLALKHLDLVHCEMKAGDALFFHSNLLHRSDQNLSENPRWGLICCYNTRHNPCNDLPGHPCYSKLEKWDDSRMKELGERQLAMMQAEPATV